MTRQKRRLLVLSRVHHGLLLKAQNSQILATTVERCQFYRGVEGQGTVTSYSRATWRKDYRSLRGDVNIREIVSSRIICPNRDKEAIRKNCRNRERETREELI